MAKQPHFAQSISGEVTSALASVLGDESPLIAWNRRVGRIKVDGIPLDEQHARFKRPDDAIYHKQTHEAIMGADMVAGLGLDEEIENITSRDKPDLILHFRAGQDIYADFTRACVDLDEANDEAIRGANRRLRLILAANPPADFKGKSISPHVTLRLRPVDRINEEPLFQEIDGFVRTFDGRFGRGDRFGPDFPLLASLGATFWWSDSVFKGWETVVSTMFESRDLPSLVQTVKDRIESKAGVYPERPIWLFISISQSWANHIGDGAARDFLRAAADGSLDFDLYEFERVAIGVTGRTVFLKSSVADG